MLLAPDGQTWVLIELDTVLADDGHLDELLGELASAGSKLVLGLVREVVHIGLDARIVHPGIVGIGSEERVFARVGKEGTHPLSHVHLATSADPAEQAHVEGVVELAPGCHIAAVEPVQVAVEHRGLCSIEFVRGFEVGEHLLVDLLL